MDFFCFIFFFYQAIESLDCDIYAKVCLDSPLFIFRPLPFFFFNFFISVVFKEFNEAENIVM